MRTGYVVQRILLFFAIMWLAATINFVLPRLATGRDPIREQLIAQSMRGGFMSQSMEVMVQEYRVKFGLDEPLPKQYVNYLWNTIRFDL
ncbi:MAG: ABC transporter permease, partial [Chloroflexi bacterium]|nr:ABC transporter permease [Chloroflexota bacterium]